MIALGVAIRIAFALATALSTRAPAPFHHPDTDGYLEPAFDMVSFGTFTNRNHVELFRTPGYPLLLQLGVWLDEPEIVTVAIQVLLAAVTIAGVYLLARSLFENERIALVAAVLYACEPLSVIYTATLVTETGFTAVLVWALLLLVQFVRRGGGAPLVAAFTLVAIGAYLRPIAFYLPVCLVVLLAAILIASRRTRDLAWLGAAALVFIAMVLPWQARNSRLGFPGFSAVSAVNMYFYNAAALRAAHSGRSFLGTQQAMGYPDDPDDSAYVAAHPEQATWSRGERARYQAIEGRREVLADIPGYARMHLVGMLRVLADPGIFGALKELRLYPARGGLRDVVLSRGLGRGVMHLLATSGAAAVAILLFAALLGLVYWFAARGLRANGNWKDPAVMAVVLVSVYFVILSGGPVGEGRFRHPVMPVLCILAATGWTAYLDRRNARRHPVPS